jgi:hypothetical protein
MSDMALGPLQIDPNPYLFYIKRYIIKEWKRKFIKFAETAAKNTKGPNWRRKMNSGGGGIAYAVPPYLRLTQNFKKI